MKKQILKKILATTLALTCSISSFQISSLANSSLANNSWIKKGNFWSYLDKDGKLAKGWVLDKGKWYYLDENGIMKTSWVKINNRWFFLNPDKGSLNGAMLTGWNWVDGNCYYFDNNGYLLQDQISPDGYRVDASGRWVDNNLKPYFIKDKGFKSKPEEMSSNKKTPKIHSGSSGSFSSSKLDSFNSSLLSENENKKDNSKIEIQNKEENISTVSSHDKYGLNIINVADYEKSNILAVKKTKEENLASIQEKLYKTLENDEQKSNLYFLDTENIVVILDLNNIISGKTSLAESETSEMLEQIKNISSNTVYMPNEDNILVEADKEKLNNLDNKLILFSGFNTLNQNITAKYILGLPNNTLNAQVFASKNTKEIAGINFISDKSKALTNSNGAMISVKSEIDDFELDINNNTFSFKEDDTETGLYRAIGIYLLVGKLNIKNNIFRGHNIKNSQFSSKNAHGMIDCRQRLSGNEFKNKSSEINISENQFKNIYSAGILLYASEREAVNITNNSFDQTGEQAILLNPVGIEYPLEHKINIKNNDIKNYGLNENTGYTNGGYGKLGEVNSGEFAINLAYYEKTQKGSKVNGHWHSNTKQLVNRLIADNNIQTKEENDKNPGVLDSQAVLIGQKDRYIDTAQKINQARSFAIKNSSIVIVKDENGNVVYGQDPQNPTSEIVVNDLYITGDSYGVVTLPNTLVIKGNLKVDLPNGSVKLEARVEKNKEINASTIKSSAVFTVLEDKAIARASYDKDYAIKISDITDDDGKTLTNPKLDIEVTLANNKLDKDKYHYEDGTLFIHKDVINNLYRNEKLSIKIKSPENKLSEVSSQLILIEISNMSNATFEYSTKKFSHLDAEAPIKIKVSNIKNNKGEIIEASKTKLSGNVDFLIFGSPQDKRLISVDDDTDTITLSTELLNYLYPTKYENTPERNANIGLRNSYDIVINDASNNIYDAKDRVEFEVIDRSGVDFVFEQGKTFTQGQAPEKGITLSIKNAVNTRGQKVTAAQTKLKDELGRLNMNVEPFPVVRSDDDDSELIVIRDSKGDFVKEVFNPKYIVIDDDKDTITFTKEYLDKIKPHKDTSTEHGIKLFTFKYVDTHAKLDVRSQKVDLHVKLEEKPLSNNTKISFKENSLYIEADKIKFNEKFNLERLMVASVLKNVIKHNPRQQVLILRNSKKLRSFDSVANGDIVKIIAENGTDSVQYSLDFSPQQTVKLYKDFKSELIKEFGDNFIIVKAQNSPTIKTFLESINLLENVTAKVVANRNSEAYEPTKDSSLRSDMKLVLTQNNKEYTYDIRIEDGKDYRALLIGNQDYGNPKLNLAGPENDLRMMNNLLSRASFEGERFKTIESRKNVDKTEFIKSIETTFANTSDEDISYIYYSGHGFNIKESNTSYICTIDNSPENTPVEEVAKNWLSVNELKEILDNIKGTKVLILDCCNAGGFIGKSFVDANSRPTYKNHLNESSKEFVNSTFSVFSDIKSKALDDLDDIDDDSSTNSNKENEIESNNTSLNYLTDNDYKILVASSANEYSFESKKTATGKFTLEFVKGAGFENGNLLADKNSDNKVGLDEMYTHLMETVESTSHIQVFPHKDNFTLIEKVDKAVLNSSTLVKIKNNAYTFNGRQHKRQQLGTITSNLVEINTAMSRDKFMENIEASYIGQEIKLVHNNGQEYTADELLKKADTNLLVIAANNARSKFPVVVKTFINKTPDNDIIIKGNSEIKVLANEEREIYTISLKKKISTKEFVDTIKNINKDKNQTYSLLNKTKKAKDINESTFIENLDKLVVTSKDASRKANYNISLLISVEESIDSEFKLEGGILSSGTQKLTSNTKVQTVITWLKQNNIRLDDPLSGIYKKNQQPPFGRPKNPGQKLEEGDRLIIRDLLTGRNKTYNIKLDATTEETSNTNTGVNVPSIVVPDANSSSDSATENKPSIPGQNPPAVSLPVPPTISLPIPGTLKPPVSKPPVSKPSLTIPSISVPSITLPDSDSETSNKLSSLLPDFADQLTVESNSIKSNKLQLSTKLTVKQILDAWTNKADFDTLIDKEKSGVYIGNTNVINSNPNKPKKGDDDTLGYNDKLILIPLDKSQNHISYEFDLDSSSNSGISIPIPNIVISED